LIHRIASYLKSFYYIIITIIVEERSWKKKDIQVQKKGNNN
jgi:hypothetical protein